MLKNVKGLWTNAIVLYLDEDKEQDEGFWGKIWGMVGGCKGIFYKEVGKEFDLA
jgi:hypothetical protein